MLFDTAKVDSKPELKEKKMGSLSDVVFPNSFFCLLLQRLSAVVMISVAVVQNCLC